MPMTPEKERDLVEKMSAAYASAGAALAVAAAIRSLKTKDKPE
jgi:hypothetical protein